MQINGMKVHITRDLTDRHGPQIYQSFKVNPTKIPVKIPQNRQT